jgi:hypothetical protein
LFQEFEQVIDEDASDVTTPSTSTETSSLGVGLAVVARYVRNMNGQIRVQSELGKGTIFGIELPFEHAATTPTVPQMSPTPSDQTPVPKDISATASAADRAFQRTKQMGSRHIGPTMLPDGFIVPSPDLKSAENMTSAGEPTGALSSDSSTDHSGSTFPFPQMDAEPRRDRLCVLIAEDNPVNARVLTRRLQKLGHEVELALDGQQCHDHFTLNPHNVDVILMDLQVSRLGRLI